jgi:hypothetical protein
MKGGNQHNYYHQLTLGFVSISQLAKPCPRSNGAADGVAGHRSGQFHCSRLLQ